MDTIAPKTAWAISSPQPKPMGNANAKKAHAINVLSLLVIRNVRTLPKPEWTHPAHLVFATALLAREGLDKAEMQAIGGEPHPAQGKNDGIEGREDREDQDESDCGRNEKRSGMAV